MRTITDSMADCLSNTAYTPLIRATAYPSRMYFGSITENHPFPSPDAMFVNDPVPQSIIYSPQSSGLVTFFNDAGTLKYICQGEDVVVSTAYAIQANPGVYNDSLFTIRDDGAGAPMVCRYTIDWVKVAAHDANPLSLVLENLIGFDAIADCVAVHGVDDDMCVVVGYVEGGFSAEVETLTALGYSGQLQGRRFMFPVFCDYTEGDSIRVRSISSLGIFSSAAKRSDGIVFLYMSDNATGVVRGVQYDTNNLQWSDTFIAFQSDLKVSLCEFRVANCYSANDVIYMAGQFRRKDALGVQYPYTVILSSVNGRAFSVDRFGIVTDIGYRFMASLGDDNILRIANCNRVCVADAVATWKFNGNDLASCDSVDIPGEAIKSFVDSNSEVATLDLVAGDESFLNAGVSPGWKVVVETGYRSPAGDEYVVYGTYIIDRVTETYQDGGRVFSCSCVNVTEWLMDDLSAPFYVEIQGKSMIIDKFSTEDTDKSVNELMQMYVAPNTSVEEDHISVDMWGHEPYDDTSLSIVGVSLLDSGGVNYYEAAAGHLHAIRSRDLLDHLDITSYPTITSLPITVTLYGWSHSNESGTENDIVEAILFLEAEDGTESVYITNEDSHWQNNWPADDAGGTDPIVITIASGIDAGTKITAVGMLFEEPTHATMFCPSRIDVSGITAPVSFYDTNTPWDHPEDENGKTLDGVLEIPGTGRPYIMFSQKPYNADRFILRGQFECDVTDGVTGYPMGFGLVGLATDANNCIIGRWNVTAGAAGQWEIVMARDGKETVLASANETKAFGTRRDMMFKYSEGRFEIMCLDSFLKYWISQLVYEWEEANGWMVVENVSALKCGIYGYMGSPYYRTTGVNAKAVDGLRNSYAVPYLPGSDISDFPDSGYIQIGDTTFKYSSKVIVSDVDGPWQLRQYGEYKSPYGDGWGLDCRAFDWWRDPYLYEGRICALDHGGNYLVDHSYWQVWTKTSGVRIDLPNRSRHYSTNTQIGKTFHSLSNRVWLTGGLVLDETTPVTSGTVLRYYTGEVVRLKFDGTIKSYLFAGSGGDESATVETISNKVVLHCGGSATFPGSSYLAPYNAGDCVEKTIMETMYGEGFDITAVIGVSEGPGMYLAANISIDGEDSVEIDIDPTVTPGTAHVNIYKSPSWKSLGQTPCPCATTGYNKFRVFASGEFVEFYINDAWVHTFFLDEGVVYPTETPLTVALFKYDEPVEDMTSLYVSELCDAREAVYIDLDTNGISALGNVIQERPVEVTYGSAGDVRIQYTPAERANIPLAIDPRTESIERTLGEGSSDGVVYSTSDVKTIRDELYIETFGWGTKIYRYPNIDKGAFKATRAAMKAGYEKATTHVITMRPDYRIEVGDEIYVSYVLTGTERQMESTIVVEKVDLSYRYKSNSMRITGREAL